MKLEQALKLKSGDRVKILSTGGAGEKINKSPEKYINSVGTIVEVLNSGVNDRYPSYPTIKMFDGLIGCFRWEQIKLYDAEKAFDVINKEIKRLKESP